MSEQKDKHTAKSIGLALSSYKSNVKIAILKKFKKELLLFS